MILTVVLIALAVPTVFWLQARTNRADAALQHWIDEERGEQDAILDERVR